MTGTDQLLLGVSLEIVVKWSSILQKDRHP